MREDWACMQDSKKIKSSEPYFELLTTELVATEDRVFNVARFLPSIMSVPSKLLIALFFSATFFFFPATFHNLQYTVNFDCIQP